MIHRPYLVYIVALVLLPCPLCSKHFVCHLCHKTANKQMMFEYTSQNESEYHHEDTLDKVS